MSLKEDVVKRGMELMADPRMQKVMQNPQVMRGMMMLMQMPGKVSTFQRDQAEWFAGTFRLATVGQLKSLQRTVKKLEKDLARLQEQVAALRPPR